jgi:hypothetical protein
MRKRMKRRMRFLMRMILSYGFHPRNMTLPSCFCCRMNMTIRCFWRGMRMMIRCCCVTVPNSGPEMKMILRGCMPECFPMNCCSWWIHYRCSVLYRCCGLYCRKALS